MSVLCKTRNTSNNIEREKYGKKETSEWKGKYNVVQNRLSNRREIHMFLDVEVYVTQFFRNWNCNGIVIVYSGKSKLYSIRIRFNWFCFFHFYQFTVSLRSSIIMKYRCSQLFTHIYFLFLRVAVVFRVFWCFKIREFVKLARKTRNLFKTNMNVGTQQQSIIPIQNWTIYLLFLFLIYLVLRVKYSTDIIVELWRKWNKYKVRECMKFIQWSCYRYVCIWWSSLISRWEYSQIKQPATYNECTSTDNNNNNKRLKRDRFIQRAF